MQYQHEPAKRYFVTRKLECPECQGSGLITNAWKVDSSVSQIESEVQVKTLAESESMKMPCQLCDGLGEVKTDVSFIEALVETLKGMVIKK